MIEKHIQVDWQMKTLFDSAVKVAAWQPTDTHVPPEITAFIQNLEPDPRFAYVHTIGMSDGDWYGSNLNGDIFKQAELLGMQAEDEAMKNEGDMRGVAVPRIQTFQQAKYFRHHNNRPNSPFYGDIPIAAWNAPMHRVEMVIRIAKQDIPELGMRGAPDIIFRLERDGSVSVSMGTKITQEECTYCGATNEYIKDRCHHLKNQMGQIMPNGVKVAAINYGMRFFDLSDVTVPADPIACSVAKVASASVLNQAFDVEDEKISRLVKWSDIRKTIPGVGVPIEKTVRYDKDKKTAAITEYAPATLSDMLKVAALEEILGTAALCGVVFSPTELSYLTLAGQDKTASSLLGFRRIPLDRFCRPVYDLLQTKFAERSGYVAPCPAANWDPTKVASSGFADVADYYGAYRAYLGSFPRESFLRVIHAAPIVREMHGTDSTKIANCLYHLAHAGMPYPTFTSLS